MTTWTLNEVVARRHAISLLEATVFFFYTLSIHPLLYTPHFLGGYSHSIYAS